MKEVRYTEKPMSHEFILLPLKKKMNKMEEEEEEREEAGGQSHARIQCPLPKRRRSAKVVGDPAVLLSIGFFSDIFFSSEINFPLNLFWNVFLRCDGEPPFCSSSTCFSVVSFKGWINHTFYPHGVHATHLLVSTQNRPHTSRTFRCGALHKRKHVASRLITITVIIIIARYLRAESFHVVAGPVSIHGAGDSWTASVAHFSNERLECLISLAR